MDWRNEKPTDKQKQAIKNILDGWKITNASFRRRPKTKGEAADILDCLIKEVAAIKEHQEWMRKEFPLGDDDYDSELADAYSSVISPWGNS